MNRDKRVEEYSKQYPHLQAFIKCQQNAFMMAGATGITGGICLYFGQEIMRRFVHISPKFMIAGPMFGGVIIGYFSSRMRAKTCQSMWLAMQEEQEMHKKERNLVSENNER